jgi:hypothetical protein
MINQPFQIVPKNVIQNAVLVLATKSSYCNECSSHTLAKENVPDTFIIRSVLATEDMAKLSEFLISTVLCIQ